MCWDLEITNPDYQKDMTKDIFRLNELYDDRDNYFKYTEEEIEIINKLLKESGNL